MHFKEKLAVLERESEKIVLPKSSKIYLLFPLLIAMVVIIFAWQNRTLLRTEISVHVEPAIAIKSTGTRHLAPNSVVFQAAGWIEADPFASKITSFITGIVDEIHVIDGQKVKKGDLLATINSEELKLELLQKENLVNQKQQHLEIAMARLQQSKAALEHLDARVDTQKAAVGTMNNLFRTYKENKEAIAKIDLDQARFDYENSVAKEKEITNEIFQLKAGLKLRASELKLATAELKGSKILQQLKALDLERCSIIAPVDGVIMALNTAPGSSEGPGKELMQIFDPKHLQIRVDVLFADTPILQLNQPTEIKLDALPNRKLKGVVTSIVGQADLQRNTIQAKVKIINPDPLLRPDMLARVQFMMPPSTTNNKSTESDGLMILIPISALRNRKAQASDVWVVSRSSKQTELRNIKLGSPYQNQWIEVMDGIRPGEWVITNPSSELQANSKVKIIQLETN